MPREIELKFRVRNLDKLLQLLQKKEIQVFEAIVQIDKTFFKKGKSFLDLNKGEPVIRIRRVDNGTFVTTLKKYINGVRDRAEIECGISDDKAFEKYLEYLSYYPIVEVVKERREAKYKKATITIDNVENLGHFVEIEIMAHETTVDEALSEIEYIAKELGFEVNDRVNIPYDEMLYNKLNEGEKGTS